MLDPLDSILGESLLSWPPVKEATPFAADGKGAAGRGEYGIRQNYEVFK